MEIIVKNETLKKLTNEEAQNLGLFRAGCMFVRGMAKKRVKGYKTVLSTESEMHYEQDGYQVQLVALASKSVYDGKEMQDWCVRIVNKDGKYENMVQPMFAVNFVKV